MLTIAFGATSAFAAKRPLVRGREVKTVMQRAAPMFQATDTDNNGSSCFFELGRVAVARNMASCRPS